MASELLKSWNLQKVSELHHIVTTTMISEQFMESLLEEYPFANSGKRILQFLQFCRTEHFFQFCLGDNAKTRK